MKKLAVLSVILLSACRTTWGPHSLTLTSVEGVTLTSRRGDPIEFESETIIPVTATYLASKKVLTLQQEGLSGQKYDFDFKNVTFNKDDDALVGDQTSTGQNLAVSVKRILSNENTNENELVRGCTYYESRPREHCYPTHNGGYHCSTTWEQYPVRGNERVREITIVRNYTLSGALSQSIGTMAQLKGTYNDIHSTVTPLSPCL